MENDLRRLAVERAYHDHADDVYRVAYAILRDAEAASDAAHEAFARAFERWEQYDANRPLLPWLHGIVSHAAFDTLRRRRVRWLALPALGSAASERAEDAGAGDPASAALRRRLVDEGLASLKPAVRAAVVLRHYYGYGYAEIATFLGTSAGNVGSMLTRAHADLRSRLATEGDASGSEAGAGRRAVR